MIIPPSCRGSFDSPATEEVTPRSSPGLTARSFAPDQPLLELAPCTLTGLDFLTSLADDVEAEIERATPVVLWE